MNISRFLFQNLKCCSNYFCLNFLHCFKIQVTNTNYMVCTFYTPISFSPFSLNHSVTVTTDEIYGINKDLLKLFFYCWVTPSPSTSVLHGYEDCLSTGMLPLPVQSHSFPVSCCLRWLTPCLVSRSQHILLIESLFNIPVSQTFSSIKFIFSCVLQWRRIPC